MSKKKKALVAALVVLGIAAVGLAVGVYAKYIASFEKTGGATIAKWAFSTDNTTGTITCELDKTYTAATLVSGRIAPGTSGKCPIAISNASSEVGVDYTIKPKAVTGQPTNLVLYKDAGHTEVFSTAAGETITGTLTPGQSAGTMYVYWEWKYETGDAATGETIVDDQKAGDANDTANGVAGGDDGTKMSITFEVQGVQTKPVATN